LLDAGLLTAAVKFELWIFSSAMEDSAATQREKKEKVS
jgi:hypothetical protein